MAKRGPEKKYPNRIYTQLSDDVNEKVEKIRNDRGQTRASFLRECVHEYLNENFEEEQLQLMEEAV